MHNALTTMSIALYNLGVEHEHLNEFGESLHFLNRGLTVVNNIEDRDN